MKKLLIATANAGKLKEISNFLKDLPLKIVSLSDLGINDHVEEVGKNYEENSQLKALFYSKKSGLPTIADDGGIEISALDGAPGINSKRWLGKDSTEQDIINHMIKVARELPDDNRQAFFKTVISFALPNGKVWSVSGEVEGIIARKPYLKLLKGYPYRSFFYLPKIKKYYHEDQLDAEEEKEYNHRYKAIQKLIPIISQELIS
ncbi:MAG TPA: non-canonical purine NTP pyrophosphatase [Candidatus Nanoarchaeia archaeon]|nr:non-canonical purine NTP pyrophosphatase [Candidatus Nanoarchaeia archaeon]